MKVDKPFIEAMRQATELVRTRGPAAATRFIQGLFRPKKTSADASLDSAVIEGFATPDVEIVDAPPVHQFPERAEHDALPDASGQFLSQRFSAAVGARNYKLYVPSTYAGTPVPLLLMLHGCTQNPDDFALGTRANQWAESKGWLVVYPEQIQRANAHRCWNWFRPTDQQAGGGEPAIIAGIVRQVINEYPIDTRRVYVAGLSAGGAMAAIMAHEYPELFAAAAIHSGLPVGAAHDVGSALALMKTGDSKFTPSSATSPQRIVPMIVIHGDADATVNPANADRLVRTAVETYRLLYPDQPLQKSVDTTDATADSHAYQRIRHEAPDGSSVVEQWEIHGAGHAWSGGNGTGSHADARGPDATQAMLRFFLQHTTPKEAATDAIAAAAPS